MNKAMGKLTLTDADGLAHNTDDHVYVVLSITRKEIEACDFTSALERLLVLIDTEQNVRRYRESLVIMVQGYDSDPRELCEVPEVRRYFDKLNVEWPHWLWFLYRANGGVSLVLSMLCPVKVHRAKGRMGLEFLDDHALERVVMSMVERSSSLCDRMGLDFDEFDRVVAEALDTLHQSGN